MQHFINGLASARAAISKVQADVGLDFDVYNSTMLAEMAEHTRLLLPETSRALLGLNDEVDSFSFSDYSLLVAALTAGVPLLTSAKVCILGSYDNLDRYWPESWAETLPEIDLAVAEVTGLASFDWVLVSGDIDEDALEDCDFEDRILTPNGFVKDLVKRSVVTKESFGAMLLLLGATATDKGYEIRRGRDTVKVEVSDDEIVVHGKVLKQGFMCGGLEGVFGALSFKAAYWGLWFAFSAQSGNATMGRLAYLTELYEDEGYGEIREGIAGLKYSHVLGLLRPYADLSYKGGVLDISIGNGGGVEVLEACSALDFAGIPWLPNHQVTSVYWGEGALALGAAVDGDNVVANIPWHVKSEKTLNRFALNKGTVDFEVIISG